MAFSSELGEQFILFHNSYCLGLQMNSRKITYIFITKMLICFLQRYVTWDETRQLEHPPPQSFRERETNCSRT